jgi:hypothetical protein
MDTKITQYLGVLSIHNVLLSVKEPIWNLVLTGV